WRANWPAVAIMAAVPLALGLIPDLAAKLNPGLVAPRARWALILGLSLFAFGVLIWRLRRPRPLLAVAASVLILVIFVMTKSPQLLALGLDAVSRAPLSLAVSRDIPFGWLGYSYVAFRLLHTLRDHQKGRLPELNLAEYVNFVIFFPAFTAGPIDRAERFVLELRAPIALSSADWIGAATRLIVGLFKKIVLADMLAVLAFNDVLVQYVRRPGWMWLFLYAYAFRIFLDFSGYTDIAIALGRMLGIRLPENFAAPYLKPNIALFWNSWHMSLTQWFRAYVFNPLARSLRSSRAHLPEWSVVLLTQLVTMILIGLWHGITWSFALWGLWHAIGLFVHNRWSGFVTARWPSLTLSPAMTRISGALGILLTFNYVSVGWLLFGLSTPELAWRGFRLLFSIV
ncbi:MAG TPA: MBOAT family O-acyltransferase, partial [Anaerolineales bacterium]|nr:MBOAT family O-acyltransferase [Anaerolineales bacterium]